MKKVWKKLKKNNSFKLAVVAIFVIGIGLLLYRIFIADGVLFEQNEEAFLNGVKKYYEYDSSKLPKQGSFRELTLQDMYELGWVDSLKVPNKNKFCSEDSFVRTINENGEYRHVVYLKCGKFESSVDHEAPEIVLNGSTSVIAPLYQTYTDLGVKEVKDNKDTIDVSKVVVDTSGVNTSTTGNYEVIYEVYDNNFNRARIVRNVVVAETLASRINRDKGSNYRYVGEATDNYVLFSGMLFRIVKVDGSGNVMMITDNTISNVNYGSATSEYKDSNIYKWLNKYFLSNINENSQKYLVDTTWCYDHMDAESSLTCNNSVVAKVGLLNLRDYRKSMVDNRSYLVLNSRFLLLNKENDYRIWLSDIYTDNALNTMHVSDLVGVRPVITIKGDIYLTSGNGTYDTPYKLQDYTYAKENDLLNTRLIGEHVIYSGNIFRIAGFDDKGNTKLVATDLLENTASGDLYSTGYDLSLESITPDVNKEGSLYYSLNDTAINHISEASIVTHEYSIPVFDNSKNYDQYESTKITSKISIPASYEMFSGFYNQANNHQVYWLSDYNQNNNITVLNGNNGIAFRLSVTTFPKNNVKITIYVKNSLEIASGRGTYNYPYYVR